MPLADASAPSGAGTEATGKEAGELSWRHPVGMWGLSIVNFLLRIVTLGVYDFWGRTEVRRRLWSSVRFMGQPLVYTGTGKELFLGLVIIFAVVLLPMLFVVTASLLAFGPQSALAGVVQLALYVIVMMLFGVGIYRAQRYRLSRTTWRGIRASLGGHSLSYGWTYFWTLFLIPITFGWIIPWRTTKLQQMITSNMRFGDRHFSFKARPDPLYAPFALWYFGVIGIVIGGVIAIVALSATLTQMYGPIAPPTGENAAARMIMGYATLGLLVVGYLAHLFLGAWYRARTINHFAAATRFEGAQFQGRTTGAGLLWISLTNHLILAAGFLIVAAIAVAIGAGLHAVTGLGTELVASEPTMVSQDGTVSISHGNVSISPVGQAIVIVGVLLVLLSMTLFLPVTQARSMGYIVSHLDLDGTVPVADILQNTDHTNTTGEGLAQAFDVDAF